MNFFYASATNANMDSRFSAIHNDPRFARKKVKDKRKKKIEKDDRFAAMDTDRDFSVVVDATTDKYGRRKIEKKSKKLKKRDGESSNKDREGEEEEEEEEDGRTFVEKQLNEKKQKGSSKQHRGHEDADVRMERLNRLARGEAFDSDYSDSSSSDSDEGDKYEDVGSSGSSNDGFSDDNEDDDKFFDQTGKEENSSDLEIPEGAEKIYNENLRRHEAVDASGEETKRLAVVNLDWDRVRAVDLHSLLQSFLSGAGSVTRVSIFPSEFGMKMMAQDEQFGPQGIYLNEKDHKKRKDDMEEEEEEDEDEEEEDDEDDHSSNSNSNSNSNGDGDGDGDDDDTSGAVDREKLRNYEMQKLQYYFGIVECNSVGTAISLYNQCDGLEYESSSLVLDLRYVPDDVKFAQAARTTSTHIPESYKPPEYFYSHALQSTNVKLTWDEPEIERSALSSWTNNKNSDKNAYAEQDLRTYLAEASEESDLEEERWSSGEDEEEDEEEDKDEVATSGGEKDQQKMTKLRKKEKKEKKKKNKKEKKKRKKEKKEKKKKNKRKY